MVFVREECFWDREAAIWAPVGVSSDRAKVRFWRVGIGVVAKMEA